MSKGSRPHRVKQEAVFILRYEYSTTNLISATATNSSLGRSL